MENVNIVRYARVLKLSIEETKELLVTVLKNASQALYGRTNLLVLNREGFIVYGIPFDHYKVIWASDREEIITDPNQRTLVKRMHVELSGWELKPGSWHEDQLTELRSMSAQDMVRAGFWVSRANPEELIEEEVEDDL